MDRSKVKLKEFDSQQGLVRGRSKFVEGIWYLVKITFFLTALPYPAKFKVFLLKLFGAKIGGGLVIKPRVNIHFPWKLEIGNDVWIGEEVFILNFESVKIQDNVCISQRAFLCCGNHDYRSPVMPYRNKPIILESGCWVGACSFVGPGVKIGVDSVISAGSVVTKDIKPFGVYKGNPPDYMSPRWK